MIYIKKRLPAITLLESLIYVALFGIIFVSIMQYFLSTSESNRKATERKELETANIFINEHMSDTFTSVSSVNTANSVFNSDTGKLRVIFPNTQYGEYNLLNNRLNYNKNGTNYYITNTRLNVSQLFVEQVLLKGNIVGVRITLSINSIKDPSVKGTYTNVFNLK